VKEIVVETPLAPAWVANWRGNPDDVKLPPQKIIPAIYEFEKRWFKRPSAQTIAGILDQLFALFGTPTNIDEIIPHYRTVLEQIPNDLCPFAFQRCIAKCKFMPKPAEIKAMVQVEINLRNSIFFRMKQYRFYSEKKKWD